MANDKAADMGDRPPLFRALEDLVSGDCELVDLSAPLDELGAFCNLFLPYVSNLVKFYQNKGPDFDNALAKSRANLPQLAGFVQNQEKFKQTVETVVALLSDFDNDSDAKIAQIEKIKNAYLGLLYTKMKRAQIEITLLTNKVSMTREVIKTKEAITKWTESNLVPLLSEEMMAIDPLLVSVDACKQMETFLTKHTKPYMKCFCRQRADVFAIPCSCPCYCAECWQCEKDGPCDRCPRCDKPVTEFVQVTHD